LKKIIREEGGKHRLIKRITVEDILLVLSIVVIICLISIICEV
jgi:hypothetical protein